MPMLQGFPCCIPRRSSAAQASHLAVHSSLRCVRRNLWCTCTADVRGALCCLTEQLCPRGEVTQRVSSHGRMKDCVNFSVGFAKAEKQEDRDRDCRDARSVVGCMQSNTIQYVSFPRIACERQSLPIREHERKRKPKMGKTKRPACGRQTTEGLAAPLRTQMQGRGRTP